MTLAIIILHFNTADLTVACLRTVDADLSSTPAKAKIIVVDNGSTDDSPAKLAAAIADIPSAELLRLPKNGGFAHGNNRGIERAGDADFFLLLNSDTLLHPGCLARCIQTMESDRQIGALGCLLESADGSPQNAARRFPTPFRAVASAFGLPWKLPDLFGFADTEDPNWDRRTMRRDVDWLGGAFLFIRGEALRKCGPLDEDFFFYGEDVEFCHRLWKHGYRCHYDPRAAIVHLGGSSNSPDQIHLRKKARYLVQKKCYGSLAAGLVRTADAVAASIRSVLR